LLAIERGIDALEQRVKARKVDKVIGANVFLLLLLLLLFVVVAFVVICISVRPAFITLTD
jgi:hypothetical protein